MKMLTSKEWKICLALLFIIAGGVFITNRVRSEHRIDELLRPEGHHGPEYGLQQEAALKKFSWQLYNLWMARDKRDVTSEIVPFLQDKYGPLRESAAVMLGRLESADAEAPLREKLQEMQSDALKLSLGRIQSRGMKGQAKVEVVVRTIGLSWGDTARLSERVKAVHSNANGSVGQRVVNEVVDVLYQMGKRGQDIRPFISRLDLYPPQQVLLQGAMLPADEEAKLIVDYLTQLKSVTSNDARLAEFYLVNLGPPAVEALVQRLNEMKQGQVQYGQRGYVPLFSAAALTGDARVVPLLKHFAATGKQPLSGYARMSLEYFEFIGQWASPRCPWPPLP